MNITTISWEWRRFADFIDPLSLYQVLQLRGQVFIVEQACAYQDVDGKDPQALHLLGWLPDQSGGRQLAAYARLFLPEQDDQQPVVFGRVVVSSEHRQEKLGQQLMAQILAFLEASPFHQHPIVISAQHYLVKFYAKFGFQPVGDVYDEDGIPHIEMRLR